MKAGRELDALVAEKVMGWTRHPDKHSMIVMSPPSMKRGAQFDQHPQYSTDIAAAMEVVDHTLRTWDKPEWEPEFSLACCLRDKDEPPWWEARFGVAYGGVGMDEEWLAWGESESRTHAICLAALGAKGIDA